MSMEEGLHSRALLALVGIYPQTLVLVAYLCVGTAVVLSGAALGSKMMTVLHR
jgi:hypothetical protein